MALVIENTYKSDAKPPRTSKIYYGPEMTFGAKSATVVKYRGMIHYRKFTTSMGSLVALFISRSIFFQSIQVGDQRNFYYGRSISRLLKPVVVVNFL